MKSSLFDSTIECKKCNKIYRFILSSPKTNNKSDKKLIKCPFCLSNIGFVISNDDFIIIDKDEVNT